MSRQKYTIPRDELAGMIEAGMTNAEIAEHFGCGVRTLQTRMKKYGLMRWEYYDFDPEELRRLYEDEGLTCQEIADMKGCCVWTAWRYIRRVAETRPPSLHKENPTGEDHWAFKRGWFIRGGYKFILVSGEYVQEHRLVIEEIIGRPLEAHEHVHHIDEDKLNNDPSNLILLTGSEHSRLHAAIRKNPNLYQREWLMRDRAKHSPLPVATAA